jgi:NAD(P)-dependent dehydrogenase (short-subunit alcohol dehydrogenase family)
MGQIFSWTSGRWNIPSGTVKDSSFSKSVVLITGAGSGKPIHPEWSWLYLARLSTLVTTGIGQCVAHQLALQGCEKLFLVDLSINGLEKTKSLIQSDGLDPEIILYQADITVEESVRVMVQTCSERFARVDVAVNNAGIAGSSTKTADQTLEEYSRVCNVNEKGVSHSGHTSFFAAKHHIFHRPSSARSTRLSK